MINIKSNYLLDSSNWNHLTVSKIRNNVNEKLLTYNSNKHTLMRASTHTHTHTHISKSISNQLHIKLGRKKNSTKF